MRSPSPFEVGVVLFALAHRDGDPIAREQESARVEAGGSEDVGIAVPNLGDDVAGVAVAVQVGALRRLVGGEDDFVVVHREGLVVHRLTGVDEDSRAQIVDLQNDVALVAVTVEILVV